MRKPNYDAADQQKFLEDIAAHFKSDVVTQKQIQAYIEENDLPYPHFLINDKKRRVKWGTYRVTDQIGGTPPQAMDEDSQVAALINKPTEDKVGPVIHHEMVNDDGTSLIPIRDPKFVQFGFFPDLIKILEQRWFYPVYFVGDTGCGKTEMVIQACARAKRELIRVNITKETDELDLIGSYELVNGTTYYREGPVITAMKRGAILLLDEIDYGSERLLCMQPILEGKPYFNKKLKKMIHPAEGFNIMVTANTKGRGSIDGRFIGANTLNEAMLERLAITVECDYPNKNLETKILMANFEEMDILNQDTEEFTKKLVEWAESVRKSYADGAVTDVISTRRLIHIARAYKMFNNRRKVLTLCLNRFDTHNKVTFIDLYSKLDPNIDGKRQPAADPNQNQPKKSSGLMYIPIAAQLGKQYKSPVVITDHQVKSSCVVVESHGQSTEIPIMGITVGSKEFIDKMNAAVEANMRKVGKI